MNLTVRFRNPVFWWNIAMAVVAPILAYFGFTGEDMTTWAKVAEVAAQAIANPYVVVMVAVSVWNALNDPTTAGIKDSARAMTYEKPFKDGDAV